MKTHKDRTYKFLWAFPWDDKDGWMLITHKGRCESNTVQLKKILKAWIKSLDKDR